jgi:surface protein
MSYTGPNGTHGNINHWCFPNVMDFSFLFAVQGINADISCWDVSRVTNMNSMFLVARAFNQNIGSWDVSRVTNMNAMFSSASAFNQNIQFQTIQNLIENTQVRVSPPRQSTQIPVLNLHTRKI